MKKLIIFAFLGLSTLAFSQNVKKAAIVVPAEQAKLESQKKAAEEKAKLPKPYDPKADAQADINKLVAQAKKDGKNIMIQAGGNWCIWCLRFNNFVQTTPELKELAEKNYVYYHLNYSPENKNERVFGKYINVKEQQFYPFFIILDKNGKKVHIQQSEILEDGKGYSKEKVKEFLEKWKPS
ncbi:thioredoxin family protein [Chryseobacterium sp. RU33C]|uniref:thioredoxin family protein n=1 Tax=Chryseobacterium sp. RU33C TaxID=1907398 RepID=UPI0009711E39|nr:thioredoxin family protein [Chryseobacterium sp. RU33C]